MATPTPTNGIWQYRIMLSRASQVGMITTFLRNDGTPATTDYFDFCNTWLAAREAFDIITQTKELLVAEWKITSHVLQAVSPTRYVPFGRDFGGVPIDGTLAGTSLPINTMVAIERATAQGNRSGQGTLKPPFGSSLSTANREIWNGGFMTQCAAWGLRMTQAFVGAFAADRLMPCIWSSQPGFPTYDFRAVNVKRELRTMSRRTVGRGI